MYVEEAPRTPSSLAVTDSGSSTSTSLVWTQDTVQPVTRFFLRWMYIGPCGSQPSQSAIVSGAVRSFTVTGLEEGGNYTFGMTAFNGEGPSLERTTSGQTLPSGLWKLNVLYSVWH